MVYNLSSFNVLPGTCIGCQQNSQRQLDLCQQCEAALSHNTHCCAQCALPLPTSAARCGQCQRDTPPFDRTVAPFQYQGDIAAYIQAFKYRRKLAYGRVLGQLMAAHIHCRYDTALPDMLLPVPLHWWKLLRRGYNQALELSLTLEHYLGIALQTQTLQRPTAGQTQSELTRQQRLNALQNVFSIEPKANLRGLHVALVDDVMTTGATARTLATLLKDAGCHTVDVWTIARTPDR